MNIDRHNYESFFLLYADKELSAVERKAVEDFVITHPDLQPELDILLQTVLIPEPAAFMDKSQLFRISDATHEQMLCLLDGELDQTAAANVTAMISNDTFLQQEWLLLQKTRLEPADTIVFENKEQLYRHAPARVIPARWWKIAAAAMLAGLGTWGVLNFINTDKTIQSTAGNAGTSLNNLNNINSNTATPAVTPGTNSNTDAAAKINADASTAATVTPGITRTATVPAARANGDDNTAQVSPKRTPRKESDPLLQNINNDPGNETNNINVLPSTTSNNYPGKNAVALVETFNTPVERVNTIQPAITPPTETAIAKAQPAVYVPGDDGYGEPERKSPLRGLFRKFTRVFSRNTGINGNGRTIKVANFEIAAR